MVLAQIKRTWKENLVVMILDNLSISCFWGRTQQVYVVEGNLDYFIFSFMHGRIIG